MSEKYKISIMIFSAVIFVSVITAGIHYDHHRACYNAIRTENVEIINSVCKNPNRLAEDETTIR